jgi:energy-coupling factor transport system permease protein
VGSALELRYEYKLKLEIQAHVSCLSWIEPSKSKEGTGMTNLGVYYPTDSFWHGIDPRCKLLVVFFLMTATWLIIGLGWLVLLGLLIFIFSSSRLPMNLPIELLFKFKWLLCVTFLANLFIPFVSHNLWLTINDNFDQAAVIFGRLSVILVIATWLSWVTRPMALVEGFSRILKPLAWIKAPVMDISLVMTLVMRFIPELLADSEDIMIAQRVRGIKPRLTWKNSQIWIQSTIIPLFISSIRKSVSMAVAMEARGFRPGAPRTSMEELKFRAGDYVVVGTIGLAVVVWIRSRFSF